MNAPRHTFDTTTAGRPRHEGVNVRTWAGFRQYLCLLEEAVLDHFHRSGPGARRLYEEFGHGLDIVESTGTYSAPLLLDETTRTRLTATEPVPRQGLRLKARMTINAPEQARPVFRGTARVALVADRDRTNRPPLPPELQPLPPELRPLAVDSVDAVAHPALPAGSPPTPLRLPSPTAPEPVLPDPGSNALLWRRRVPYFHCHYDRRMQHAGYVRILEDVVDRYLAARGIAIGDHLATRGLVPVVHRTRIRMLADAFMEERLHTVFAVTDIIRGTLFDARMDCYVRRGDALVPTATATITHGYAHTTGERTGAPAELDEPIVKALLGEPR
ncbi:acyl-CoA thioesterase [Streptomyces sp. NPDC018045]|uniref:acyl-CoA thioesterase n=1 Tax=Streptomyces sp. NPDC018045 TaxID=3365037 RepID=UPI0037A40495